MSVKKDSALSVKLAVTATDSNALLHVTVRIRLTQIQ